MYGENNLLILFDERFEPMSKCFNYWQLKDLVNYNIYIYLDSHVLVEVFFERHHDITTSANHYKNYSVLCNEVSETKSMEPSALYVFHIFVILRSD